MQSVTTVQRPVSATHGTVAATGVLSFLLAVAVVTSASPFGENIVPSALLVMGASATAIILVDLTWRKVHRRPSTGMDFAHDDPSLQRSRIKFAGLLGSLAFVAFLYWLFPEYHGAFYDRYYTMLRIVLPPWLLLGLPYLFFIDRRMPAPCDGYWHMGKLATLEWGEVDRGVVGQHLLGWVIKGFFLPLMFTYTCNDLGRFMAYDYARLASPDSWFDFLYDAFYFVDVGLVSMGYLMSLRLADTHLRWAEPTTLGWAVALLCYEPFWSLIGGQYLSYETGFAWGAWLGNAPILYGIWGALILALTAIYVWATIIFGARFSNLTHRGIITNGPYRWTKHPAYIAKNLSWWMISIPFMARGTPNETLRHCLLLLCLNCIYALRAKTEERHLSMDPVYEQYAHWIDNHGILRSLNRIPVLAGFLRWRPRLPPGTFMPPK